MKRKILASTLGLVILLSACSAEINSNRKDVSSLAENASESTTILLYNAAWLRGFIDRKNSCRSITARIIGAAGGYRHSLSNRG